jgi:hypothetical protein
MGRPDRVPSVGCLLYLAADRVASPSWGFWQAQVPCTRVRVDLGDVYAIAAAATFLRLRDTGHVTLRVVEWTGHSRARRPRPVDEIGVELLDSTPPDGLPGAVLKATFGLTHGHPRLGFAYFGAQPSALHETLPGGGDKSLLGALGRELVELGYAAPRLPSSLYWFRFNCARIAALEEACADAVRWWQQVQVAEASLCRPLREACRVAFKRPTQGGG